MRVNHAIADGSFFENPALLGAFRRARSAAATSTCSGSSPTAASTRTSTTCARCSSSPTARGWPPDVDPRLHRRPRRLAARRGAAISPSCPRTASRRSAAATTRWIATGAGNGQIAPSARSVEAREAALTIPSAPCRPVTPRGITDEFIEPVMVSGRPRLERGDGRRDLLQLPARPGPAALRAPARGRPRPHDDDPLPRRFRLPGGLRGAGGAADARRDALRRRRAPAARGRDGEVRARHVLLRRRRRGGLARRGAHPRPLAARRPELRPEARDVGARAGRGASAPRSATATASRSSTSPIPTWSGTPARSPP